MFESSLDDLLYLVIYGYLVNFLGYLIQLIYIIIALVALGGILYLVISKARAKEEEPKYVLLDDNDPGDDDDAGDTN